MNHQFLDRVLRCADCDADFIFTAGEQFFFFDKQFKNDPKRCKPCKGRRSGLAAAASGLSIPAGKMLRTETRYGMLCVRCRNNGAVQADPGTSGPLPTMLRDEIAGASGDRPDVTAEIAAQASVLTELSVVPGGPVLSRDAAVLAATSMAAAGADSCVASDEDLACVASLAATSERAGTDAALPGFEQPVQAESLAVPDLGAAEWSARLQN